MAASTLYRSQTELDAFMQNVTRRTDKKTAIKATARCMAHMIFRGVMYGKEYVDHGAEAYEVRFRDCRGNDFSDFSVYVKLCVIWRRKWL